MKSWGPSIWVGLFLFFFPFVESYAQEGNEEGEIYARMETMAEDTEKVDFIHGKSFPLSYSDPQLALKITRESEFLSEKLKDTTRWIRSIMLVGIIYRNQSTFDLAMEEFLRALDISRAVGNDRAVASLYNNIATIQSQEGSKEEAIATYRQARQFLLQENMITESTIPLLNIATSYYELGQYERALTVFDTVETELLAHKDERGLGSVYNNLGQLYTDMGDYEKAIDYFEKSMVYKRKVDDVIGQSDLKRNYAEALRKSGKLQEGLEKLREGLKLVENLDANMQVANIYEEFAMNYEAKGDIDKAYKFFKQYAALKDSIETSQQQEKLAKFQTMYKLNQKDAQIALLNKDKEVKDATLEKQQYFSMLLLTGIGLLILVIITLGFNIRSRQRANAVLQKKNDQIDAQKAEIQNQNEALRKQNERLEDLNREMDGVLHIVAHDLKAPLNRTSGLAHLVEISGPLTEEQISFIRLIEQVNQDAGRMILDLLDLHKIGQPETRLHFSEFELNKLMEKAAQSFSGAAGKKDIKIKTVPADGGGLVISDENSLMRILDNLVSNAIKFSPAGKSVEIGGEVLPDKFRVWVADEGPGISPEDQEKMYKKFQKLSAQPTGGESSTGLGLAIIKTLAEKLKGEIELHSEVGKGTRFTLTLPQAEVDNAV